MNCVWRVSQIHKQCWDSHLLSVCTAWMTPDHLDFCWLICHQGRADFCIITSIGVVPKIKLPSEEFIVKELHQAVLVVWSKWSVIISMIHVDWCSPSIDTINYVRMYLETFVWPPEYSGLVAFPIATVATNVCTHFLSFRHDKFGFAFRFQPLFPKLREEELKRNHHNTTCKCFAQICGS